MFCFIKQFTQTQTTKFVSPRKCPFSSRFVINKSNFISGKFFVYFCFFTHCCKCRLHLGSPVAHMMVLFCLSFTFSWIFFVSISTSLFSLLFPWMYSSHIKLSLSLCFCIRSNSCIFFSETVHTISFISFKKHLLLSSYHISELL